MMTKDETKELIKIIVSKQEEFDLSGETMFHASLFVAALYAEELKKDPHTVADQLLTIISKIMVMAGRARREINNG